MYCEPRNVYISMKRHMEINLFLLVYYLLWYCCCGRIPAAAQNKTELYAMVKRHRSAATGTSRNHKTALTVKGSTLFLC
jgi:hypothetical protein